MIFSLLIITVGVWGFIELADSVGDGRTNEWDEWTVVALRNPNDFSDPLGPRWFEELMRDFTALGGYAILLTLTCTVCLFLVMERHWHMVILLLIAVLGGVAISSYLKSFYDRPRPDLVPHGSYVYTRSFPSGHAMMAATVYLTLGAMLARLQRRRRTKILLLSISVFLLFAVGASRVYLGVHWPSDVLAGWAAGSAWALACWLTAAWIGRHDRNRLERGVT